jgi:2-polyprenyl-3-methyl-5-hydroxy-6-metoxy-1,4-benzoquinol methylase
VNDRSPTRWEHVARRTAGEDYARAYAERFRAMAARGEDVHGEATFVAGLAAPPASVLDAGCGTGRIAVRLHELGYDVVGVDVDETMLEVARADAPDLAWRTADLATLDLGRRFDVVLLAGNIVPLLEPGALPAVARRLAAHVAPGGRVVCGFGLDAAHLPAGCPVTPLADFDAAMAAAGLEPVVRWSGWDRAAFDPAAGYVVAEHRPLRTG